MVVQIRAVRRRTGGRRRRWVVLGPAAAARRAFFIGGGGVALWSAASDRMREHSNSALAGQPTWKDAVIYGRPQRQRLSFRRCRYLLWVIVLSPSLHRVHGTVYHHLFELFPPSFHSDTS